MADSSCKPAGASTSRPTIVSIAGFSSNVGKTGLACDLLRRYPGWEAIKLSRGHYRSCGKSPQACCISPLLGDKPVVLSGRRDTFAPGKDTGRYWEAGAANVHWVICTSEQVEEGVRVALGRVEREGVFIEGTSLLKYIPADYSVMVACASATDIKSSAVSVMARIDAVFVTGSEPDAGIEFELKRRALKRGASIGDVTFYFERDLGALAGEIRRVHQARSSSSARTAI